MAVAVLCASTMAPQANADPVAEFYKGRTVAIQVGFGAGGGYDTTARIFARHFGKHVPGNPNGILA